MVKAFFFECVLVFCGSIGGEIVSTSIIALNSPNCHELVVAIVGVALT